jgi:hypothetical protein
MRRVILESPLAGDILRNIEYAGRCLSIAAGLAWLPVISQWWARGLGSPLRAVYCLLPSQPHWQSLTLR